MPPDLATPARLSRFARRVRSDASGEAVLDRRHIYILPTAFGTLFGVTLLLLFFGALSAQNNPALLLTLLLAALGLVGMVHTWRNLLGLRVRIGEAQPVFAGHPARFPVQIRDPRGRERPALVLVADPDPLPLALGSGEPARAELVVSTRQRGPHRLGQARLETRYPLALFCAWCYLDCAAGVLVYPRPAATAPEGVGEASDRGQAGKGASGSGVEDFLGLRPYQPGDPLTRLHWKALARTQAPLVKDFAGEQGETLWLAWEALAPAEPELRLSLLCRQVIEADARGVPYGLRLPTRTLQPGSGAAHRRLCLGDLARFPTDASG